VAEDIRTLRLSETISPFGVGAIVDIDGESLIAMDTQWWPDRPSRRISCRRLEEALGASALRAAPSVPTYPGPKVAGLTYQRFPAWMFCERCSRMRQLYTKDETGRKPRCLKCDGLLIPMRFIAICREKSHIEDIPWQLWTHRDAKTDAQRQCRSKSGLRFRTSTNGSESLASLYVECDDCGARRHLNALSRQNALKADGVTCRGRQPWQRQDEANPCDSDLEAVQRGATNVHFAETESALDIPEAQTIADALRTAISDHPYFSVLASSPTGPYAEGMAQDIAEACSTTADVVRSVAAADGGPAPDLLESRRGLRDGEWAAFHSGASSESDAANPDFVVEPTALPKTNNGGKLTALVSDVVLVQRLREVRAMHSFYRYGPEADRVPVDLIRSGRTRRPWFPAVETFGEGIFFVLDETKVHEWETRGGLKERFAAVEKRRKESLLAARFEPITPRFVLVHTLAHLLMRRLAFDSGYASASLRERIYTSADDGNRQAGILIYTSAGDVEGTLGGLVRQGSGDRFGRTLLRSIEDADSCSNDPLCRESHGQGMNALNLAACHGCCLAPETSCEFSNLFLDRGALLNEGDGFFDALLGSVRAELAQATA
jgi:hypothetical protein